VIVRRREALALLALAGIARACRKPTSADGTRIATRVVSISASTTEALFAVGAGALVVGRSKFCDYPPEATKLPAVGGFVDPSLEATLALAPDLVVGARGPLGQGFLRALEERGIATYFPKTESFDEILAMIVGIGGRTDRAAEADAVVASLRGRRAAIQRALEGRARPKTMLLFSTKPVTCAGPGSFPDEMLALAGGENVVRGTVAYPTLGMETILALDPDVIIDAEMIPGTVAPLDATWGSMRAVRGGKVHLLRDEAVLRPGPRVLDGVASIARLLHPGVAIP
jgi:iron complex transport system substrate-binding protein